MLSRREIQLLEEMNFNAWPALRTVHYDGWLLRCTGGQSRRVNSVNPFGSGRLGIDEKIEAAEAIYRRWKRNAVFRLTPLADEGLDQALAVRGYVVEAPTFVQLADATPYRAAPQIRFLEHAHDDWLAAARVMRGLTGEEAELFNLQHRAVGVEARWALFIDGNQTIAVGVVAIERQWAGLHGIYVAKNSRRKGVARALSEALIGTAYERGARQVWLQVEQGNGAAVPLYESLGFRTAYAYQHRVRPQ